MHTLFFISPPSCFTLCFLSIGFWISSSWILAAKKYYDNVNLPISQNLRKASPNKKKPSKSQRKGSEILPPWPIINSEILCDHGGITVSKHPRAKRKTIDSKSWKVLRSYYPLGPEFSCSNDVECLLCMETDISLKAQVSEKKELEISTRKVDFVPPKLESLFSRRSGVPSNCLVARVAEFISFLEDSEDLSPEFIESLIDIGETPLISGLYNIVPRDWLREWRKFVKNPTIDKLPPLDCSSLVCYSHGLLVIPPHFEEYMLGVKKSLLSGLGTYPGEIVEILSAEEWDDLTHAMPGLPDLNVRFCLADGVVFWNTEVCTSCDPFNYSRAKAEKKRPNSKHHSYRPEVLVR